MTSQGTAYLGAHSNPRQDPSGTYDAGDGQGSLVRYRHKMNVPIIGGSYSLTTTLPLEDPTGDGPSADDELFCLTCHLAHGSPATAAGYAANVAPANDSVLLRIDNRGVCQNCHKK